MLPGGIGPTQCGNQGDPGAGLILQGPWVVLKVVVTSPILCGIPTQGVWWGGLCLSEGWAPWQPQCPLRTAAIPPGQAPVWNSMVLSISAT